MTLALVTGGTKRLGAAIAARLARDGHDLALHCHAVTEIDPDLRDAIAEAGVRHAVFPGELGDAETLTGMIDAIRHRFGRTPDIVVNSASLFTDDDWTSMTLASLVDHFRINAAAPAILAQAVARSADAGHPAVVVNILDQRIAQPHGDQMSYTVSKLALAGITQTLARTLAPHVRVCGVAPGLTIATPDYSEAQLATLTEQMPLQRLPAPEEIADAVSYLVTARASSGQVIFVDGGASLRSWNADFVNLRRSS